MRYKSSGITLLEMMIVIAIIGIVSVFSVASFKSLISESVAKVASEEVVVGFFTAKSEALKARSEIIVCALKENTQNECSGSVNDWKNGYLIIDESRPLGENGIEPLYVGQIHSPAKAIATHALFSYDGEGRASSVVKIRYCDSEDAGTAKLVRVYRTGVPKIETVEGGCTSI